ncbi:hypothetical protein F4677DRAFT_275696 [Hypoxylon crocopeplum]|nr:hypothetical protein F4677DRAFT_275696 [Hypoxylon crocopeplum]
MGSVPLYTPISAVKWTEDNIQILKIGSKTTNIRRDTMIIPSHATAHTHPSY